MTKPKRSDDKYWTGTRNFDHIKFEQDLEEYIDEIESNPIKQEQKPSDLEIKVQAKSEAGKYWAKGALHLIEKAYANGARWYRDTFASPSKEIDKEKLIKQLFAGKVSELIGTEKATQLLKEATDAINNGIHESNTQ